MKANYKEKIENKKQSEVALGNLYDMNKQMMEQEPLLNETEINEKSFQIAEWFLYSHPAEKYYMMLCHELRDYTLFNLDKTNAWKNMPANHCKIAAKDVIDCLKNRGQIIAMDLQPDGVWEMWIKTTDGCFAYYFFPYGEAVLEY